MAQEKKILEPGTTVYFKRTKMKGMIKSRELRDRKNRATMFYEVLWSDGFTTWEPRTRFILNLPDRTLVNG